MEKEKIEKGISQSINGMIAKAMWMVTVQFCKESGVSIEEVIEHLQKGLTPK